MTLVLLTLVYASGSCPRCAAGLALASINAAKEIKS